jgi:hypothetical protein
MPSTENLPSVFTDPDKGHLVSTFVTQYTALFESGEPAEWILKDIVIDLLHVLTPAFVDDGTAAADLPAEFEEVLHSVVWEHWVEESPIYPAGA